MADDFASGTANQSVGEGYRVLSLEERNILADIFESLWSGMERDEIKSKMLNHKELLDVEITLWTSYICTGSFLFEYPPIGRDEHQEERIKEYASLIRDGLCHCRRCTIIAKKVRSSSCLCLIAAAIGKAWLVEFLLDQGCHPDPASCVFGNTPLRLALARSDYDVVKLLVQRAQNKIREPTPDDGTWLHLAYKSLPILKIVHGAFKCDVNAYNSFYDTVLGLAVRFERLEEVRFLLDNGADANLPALGTPPLHLAVRDGNKEMALALIKGGADINAIFQGEGETALHLSICFASSEFHIAAPVEMTRLLLENGADPNLTHDGTPPLAVAAREDCPDIVELLIRHGAEINKVGVNGFNALHHAARVGSIDTLNVLLECGAEPDKLTSCKNTPLALAALGNNLHCLNILLGKEVNVDNADKDMDTPMHCLAYHGNVEGIQALLDHGANPDVLNKWNASPLWNAVFARNSEAVLLLALQNVYLDVKSCGISLSPYNGDKTYVPSYDEQRSLLWVAVKHQWMDGVTLLLEAGYNIWKEDWLLSGEDEGLPEESRAISRHLRALAQIPPSLLSLCRQIIKKSICVDLVKTVQQFPIPAILKDYILLKDLKLIA